jgi:hypothetical protein
MEITIILLNYWRNKIKHPNFLRQASIQDNDFLDRDRCFLFYFINMDVRVSLYVL